MAKCSKCPAELKPCGHCGACDWKEHIEMCTDRQSPGARRTARGLAEFLGMAEAE